MKKYLFRIMLYKDKVKRRRFKKDRLFKFMDKYIIGNKFLIDYIENHIKFTGYYKYDIYNIIIYVIMSTI
jgi:hypothetical protein